MVAREQYERLACHLQQDGREHVEMTFAQVARLIGEELPASAYKYSAWWASDPKHTQAVWLDVGYLARPDLSVRQVSFIRG